MDADGKEFFTHVEENDAKNEWRKMMPKGEEQWVPSPFNLKAVCTLYFKNPRTLTRMRY